MREILFRGKRIDNGEWVEGYYIGEQEMIGKKAHWILDINDYFKRFHYRSIDPDTVGQYTGLTDKNGKKIFEGDIVREDDVVRNGKIQIEGQAGRVSFVKCCYIIEFGESWDFLATNAKSVKVIGNIHDNPELLEDKP